MSSSPSTTPFFRYLLGGLILWGALVAVGAFLGPIFWAKPAAEAERGESAPPAAKATLDLRKPLIVLGCVGVFVGGWAYLLYQRSRRQRDESPAA